jgi:hypothetical protein
MVPIDGAPWHPQDRIAKKMGVNQASMHNHLLKMATLPNLINADLRVTFRLSRGFTVAQVADHILPTGTESGSRGF